MTRLSLFMIFLIGMGSCGEDSAPINFSGSEQSHYEKMMSDLEAPKYKWGYLNKNGELAIEDKYDDLREFNEGVAAANTNGLWGYIDQTGKEVLPPRFLTVQEFNEGLAVVQDLNMKFHIYRRDGTLVIDSLPYDKVNKFIAGRALFETKKRYGFLNTEGKEGIAADFEYASDFNNGLAIATKDQMSGIINPTGEVIIPFEYDKIWFPVDGMIRFKQNGKFGFINYESGNKIKNTYTNATDFQIDHAIVNDGNKYLLLDKSGKTKALPYAIVDNGGEGKWMYGSDGKFGFLNNDGSVLCTPNYDLVMRYKEDRSGFAIGESWGYLDAKGEIIIPPKFPLVWDFVDGYARMIGRTGFGFIDKEGVDILPAQYMEVRDFSEGLARIQVYR